MNELFRRFAHKIAEFTGKPIAFFLALSTVIIWLLSGPLFHFSDTWQLVINTSTTIITFLMVFLIQSSQNRDSEAFHLKLNELIRGVRGARSELVDLEEMSDDELKTLHAEFKELHEKLSHHINERHIDPKKG